MVILFDHVLNDTTNLVGANSHAPAKVADGVVGTGASRVALALEGVARDCAE